MKTNNSRVSSYQKCGGEWGGQYYSEDPIGWFKQFDVIPTFLGKYICTSLEADGRGETVTFFQSNLEISQRMTSELLLMRYRRHCPFRDEESEVLSAHKIIVDKR